MFGKKSEINPKNNPSGSPSTAAVSVNVQTIPADFYGGVNPVVKFKRVEKEVDFDTKPTLTASEKKMLDKSTAAGSGSVLHPASMLANKKNIIMLGSLLFVVILFGVSGYYYLQFRKQSNTAVPQQPNLSTETPPVQTPVVVETTTPEAAEPTTTPVSLADAPIEFPSALLGESADMDKDSITDVAEELFGADSGKPDTDDDTYNDGHEVFYLYNPAGKEPMRIIDSGYVKDYENPVFGYKVFYPLTWAVGSVDDSYRDVLFSTITGENIELRVFDRLPNQTFSDWFAQWAPSEQYQNLVDAQTRFGQVGKNRADHLVYYFVDDSHVYVVVYHTTDSNVVNFRSVMVMMARSFRSGGFTPPEVPLPASATSVYPSEMPVPVNNSGS